MEWYDDENFCKAYDEAFDVCVSDGGFDEKRFDELVSAALMESEFACGKDAYNEQHDVVMETAREAYNALCEP